MGGAWLPLSTANRAARPGLSYNVMRVTPSRCLRGLVSPGAHRQPSFWAAGEPVPCISFVSSSACHLTPGRRQLAWWQPPPGPLPRPPADLCHSSLSAAPRAQALERQKEFFDSVRSERDDLREEVGVLREELKVGPADGREGASRLGRVSAWGPAWLPAGPLTVVLLMKGHLGEVTPERRGKSARGSVGSACDLQTFPGLWELESSSDF